MNALLEAFERTKKNRLTDSLESVDIKFALENNLDPCFCVFQKLYNPLNLYCRLRELGLDIKDADRRMKAYEKIFYKPLCKKLEELK